MQIASHKILKFFFALTFILLCFTRLYQLDRNPYHHDESLYAKYSYDYAKYGTYTFNPMLHGPLLFTLQAGIFKIFGDSDYTGRLGSALPGIFIALLASLLTWLYYKKYSITLCTFIFFTLSPTLSFFSRFLGMDLLLALLAVALSYTYLSYNKTKKMIWLYLLVLTVTLMVSTKLNYLFYFFIFIAFSCLKICFECLVHSKKINLKKNIQSISILNYICIGLLFILIFSLLYSGFGQNWGGILDGLYRKMIPYWVKQHSMQRIAGPYDYYISLLFQYELPLFLGLICAYFKINLDSQLKRKYLFIFFTALAFLYFIMIKPFWLNHLDSYFKPLHMQKSYHVVLFFIFLQACVSMTWEHLKTKDYFSAFTIFWFWLSMILYAYAGEKIPWLMVHMVVPGFLYISVFFTSYIQRSFKTPKLKLGVGILLLVALSWQSLNILRGSYVFSALANNRLVYVHTTHETLDMVKKINHCQKTLPAFKFQSLKGATAVWPLHWYLRHYPAWFTMNEIPDKNVDVFITDWHQQFVQPNYNRYRYKLREWWQPAPQDFSWNRFFNYILYWQPYSSLGSYDTAAYVHPRALECWIGHYEK